MTLREKTLDGDMGGENEKRSSVGVTIVNSVEQRLIVDKHLAKKCTTVCKSMGFFGRQRTRD
jgi:hypothetical protein